MPLEVRIIKTFDVLRQFLHPEIFLQSFQDALGVRGFFWLGQALPLTIHEVVFDVPFGEIKQFLMNDKCAAGTGRFLEVTAARLRLDLESLGRIALESPNEVTVSSTCTVFAESEIVSLLARGEAVEAIVRGLHRAMVKRVASLVRSIKPQPPLLFSGGVVRNEAVRQLLCETLKIEGRPPKHPQIAGAYGAALIAVG